MAVVQESVLIKSYHMISVVPCSPFFLDTFDKKACIFFLFYFLCQLSDGDLLVQINAANFVLLLVYCWEKIIKSKI